MHNVAKRSWNQKTIIQKLIKQRERTRHGPAHFNFTFYIIEVTIIIEHEKVWPKLNADFCERERENGGGREGEDVV